MAASFSTLRMNRLGGGLPSGAGGVSWLTRTLNCRSRRARLRGAAGSAETSRLAVAREVPAQAFGRHAAGGRRQEAGRPVVEIGSLRATGAAVSTESTAAAAAAG